MGYNCLQQSGGRLMSPKIVYINSGKSSDLKDSGNDSYHLCTSDFITEMNQNKLTKEFDFFVFEDYKLFSNTHIDNLMTNQPIFFYYSDFYQLESGINKSDKHTISALFKETIGEHNFSHFLNIHTLIQSEFCNSPYKSVNFSFKSSLEDIEYATQLLEKFVNAIFNTISNLEFFEYNLILRELLTNAVKHGNKLNKEKNVMLTIFFKNSEKTLGFAVQDEGPGFNYAKHLQSIEKDELRINERGLFLINEFCSNIFNRNNLIIVEIKK